MIMFPSAIPSHPGLPKTPFVTGEAPLKKCSRCQADNFAHLKFCKLCGRELNQRVALDLHPTPLPALRPLVTEPAPRDFASEASSASQRSVGVHVSPHDGPARPALSDGATRAYEHFRAAKEKIRQRDLPSAVAEFEHALALCPGDSMIERLLMRTREALDNERPGASRGLYESAAVRSVSRAAHGESHGGLATHGGHGAGLAPGMVLSGTLDMESGRPAESMHRPQAGGSMAMLPESGHSGAPAPRSDSRRPSQGPGSGPPAAQRSTRPSRETSPAAAQSSRSGEARASRSQARPEPGNSERAGRGIEGSPQGSWMARLAATTRFLEAHPKTPSMSPALVMDQPGESAMMELAVGLLILGGFVAFGYLLML